MDRADWDALAENFEELVVDVTADETADQVSRFVDAAKLPKNAVLVDLGCGIGTFIKRFGRRFVEIEGVEHAPKIIENIARYGLRERLHSVRRMKVERLVDLDAAFTDAQVGAELRGMLGFEAAQGDAAAARRSFSFTLDELLPGWFYWVRPNDAADGSGHAFWAEQVIALDARNPQVAARMARALENWRRLTPALQASIRPQLERVRGAEGLSADVAEVVGKALE